MTGAFEPVDGVSALDRAVRCTHAGGLRAALLTWMGIMPFAFVAVAIYYVEFVEGLRLPRVGYAVLLAGSWVWRGLKQTEATRIYVQTLWPTARLSPEWELVGLNFSAFAGWSALAFGALAGIVSMNSPSVVIVMWPVVALRALGVPGLWAFAALAERSGVNGYIWALRTASWIRASAFGAALLLECAIVFTCINLLALVYLFSVLARTMLSIDTATLHEFLSLSNPLSLGLLMGGTLALAEPLRAALCAVHAVDALSRRDALDLRERIAAAIKPRHTPGVQSTPRPHIAHVLLLLAALSTASMARAQPSAPPQFDPPVRAQRMASPDRVASQVESILKKDAYQDFADHGRGSTASSIDWMLDRIVAFLKKLFESDRGQAPSSGLTIPSLGLPSGTVFLALALAVFIALACWRALTWKRSMRPASDAKRPDSLESPIELIALADDRAQAGDLRDALRALYLATLVSLDRDGVIHFEPHLTNGHYVRGMHLRARDESSPEQDASIAFRDFTAIFDRVWYGSSPPERAEFDACRSLAVRVCKANLAESVAGIGRMTARA